MKKLVNLTVCVLLIPLAAELSTAQRPELVVQTGHGAIVRSVAFSPDGRIVASGSDDYTIKLWDVVTGAELRTLAGHRDAVRSVTFSSNSTVLVSGSEDGVLKLWNVTSGVELRSFIAHERFIDSIAFSPDGRVLASGSRFDKAIRLWDAASGAELRALAGHGEGISGVAFSPDGRTLASSWGNTIKLWALDSGREIQTFAGAYGIAFSPDGKMLASGSDDQTIKLWDVASGAALRTLAVQAYVGSISFSPDGRILSGSAHDRIKLWDVASGSELLTLEHAPVVHSVAFSPDGKKLASGGHDHTIKLWDVVSGAELRTLAPHGSAVNSVAFSPDGRLLAVGSRNKTVKLWNLASGIELRTLTGHTEQVNVVAFSPDGKTLASGSEDETIKLWDVASGTELRRYVRQDTVKSVVLGLHPGEINTIAFSPDGKTLAGGGITDQAVKLWDVASAKQIRSLPVQGYTVSSLAFSPDGRMLGGTLIPDVYTLNASTFQAGSTWDMLRLWDVSSGAQLRVFKGREGGGSTAFSPDGKTIARGSNQGIGRWNVESGAELSALVGNAQEVSLFDFSSDGRILASGHGDTVKLWDAVSGAELHVLTARGETVSSIAFSPDGQMLATGSHVGKSRLWSTVTGQELASLIALDEVDWVVVTPDGLFDGSPRAWGKLIWRAAQNTVDFAPVESFFSDFYYPGLLTEMFAGKHPKPPSNISGKDRRQPRISVSSSSQQSSGDVLQTDRSVTVKIEVAENTSKPALATHPPSSGARDVRLFRNGSLVKVWRGDVLKGQRNITLDATVPIIAGENLLTVYAFNRDNIKSEDATLTVTGADSLKRKGVAYVLAVGVNKYANPGYNLKYAVADADEFGEEIKRQQAGLTNYERVQITLLTDANATKNSILETLSRLAASVQPEDALIIFFAGHGTAQGKRFYLIPHDLGYLGSRTRLNRIGLQKILAHSISDEELQKAVEGIDAGQLLLVIDACNSGQALEAEEKRRGPMNSKGLAQLAYEKGMYVMTAAQSYQAALEAAKFGHGYLTHALVVEGLKKGFADHEPRNGTIDIREWLNFATDEVPKMQEKKSREALRGRSRYVFFVGDGRREGFPRTEASVRDNIQRPRVFYRRELEANPFVVGTVGAGVPRRQE